MAGVVGTHREAHLFRMAAALMNVQRGTREFVVSIILSSFLIKSL